MNHCPCLGHSTKRYYSERRTCQPRKHEHNNNNRESISASAQIHVHVDTTYPRFDTGLGRLTTSFAIAGCIFARRRSLMRTLSRMKVSESTVLGRTCEYFDSIYLHAPNSQADAKRVSISLYYKIIRNSKVSRDMRFQELASGLDAKSPPATFRSTKLNGRSLI